ncbi:MAG: glyoxylate/hydroxypyruvate reductase A [Saprospiraceae bacterium]|nr:glyoxylate/hydroxypyruvate reductase A [Saprospiraceae bacterium]
MAIALIITDRAVTVLQQQLIEALGQQVPVWSYPNIPQPEVVKMVILWKHPKGVLNQFPNLKLISSFGAGVEHILTDDSISKNIPVTRIVDDSLSRSMRNYVLMAVLNIQRQFRQLQKNQALGKWEKPAVVELPLRIGILGLGALGGRIASDLLTLGFEVSGYSRSPKNIKGLTSFTSDSKPLHDYLTQINLLVNILPRTPATEGMLNLDILSKMPKGSFLVNVGRGSQLVEADLLKAIQLGYIQEAWLDVFSQEPLPIDHPFWETEQIVITPHIASVTDQAEAARIIGDNYRRMETGQDLLFEVDREKGY